MKFDNYCDKVYVEIHKKLEENPELQEKIKKISKLIEEGNNKIAIYARKLAEKVVKEQLKTIWNLNIFYDLLNWESDILRKKMLEKTLEFLKKKDLIEKVKTGRKKGCWVLRLSKLKEFQNLKDADKVLIRSDGTVVYAAKDIAYAFWKHGILEDEFEYKIFCIQPNGKELWSTCEKGEKLNSKFNKVDVSINVIDARQSLEQEIVKNTMKLINPNVNYIHYAYEVVSLSQKTAKKLGIEMDESKQFIHMSGRKGWFINVDTLYQKLFEKILEEVKKRNLGMEEEKCKEIAKKLTISTIRYELLKVSPEKMIIFDLDEALSLEGNTAIYVLYTYARACNILKKAGKFEENYKVEKIEDGEKKLLKHLLLFPEVLTQALSDLRPNEICNYIFTLANIFNNFYEKYPVLKSEKEGFRLELVRKTKKVLEFCFDLLGIEKLERI
jgi:arginyl-tRNA synthetase